MSFLLELVGMGYANEDFDPEQSELVNHIAKIFYFHEDGTIEAIEGWVKDETRSDEKSTRIDGRLKDAAAACIDRSRCGRSCRNRR